jgi:uncharacterized protein (DUF2267 family)
MSATGLEAFDRTLQTTNIWLDELMKEMPWMERHQALHALRVVLHTLRDHLPINSLAHLSAQLPLLIRGVLFEGWQPAKTPVRERTRDEFLMHITDEFVLTIEADPRQIAVAVFRVLSAFLSRGEAQKVRHSLPSAVRQLWLDSLPRGPAVPVSEPSRSARPRRTKKIRPGELASGDDVIL